MSIRRNTGLLTPRLLIVAFLTVVMDTSTAEEKDEWRIGKVFMTRADRLTLDKMRQSRLTTEVTDTSNRSNEPVITQPGNKASPTGYILPSDGVPYRWQDGDFRKTSRDSIARNKDAGNIRIIRHRQAESRDRSSDVTEKNNKPATRSDADRQPDHASER